MSLRKLLKRNQDALIDKWRQRIVEFYHSDSHEFVLGEKDRFQNPVGHVIREETVVLFEQLVERLDEEAAAASLERLIRIRAVQEMAPSEAVSFVFMLKPLVRELIDGSNEAAVTSEELSEIDSTIDRMALLAFDQYTICRERISQIKVNDARRQTTKLIERLNAQRAVDRGEGLANREV